MDILLVNYRYFISGGPERYLFNIKGLLEKSNHRTIPFSVRNTRNAASEYEANFLSPLGDGSQVYFREYGLTPITFLKMFERSVYSLEARRRLGALLKNRKVDVAYLLHFLRWISPSILDELKGRGIPIVVRASDFVYLCPNALCLREGKICELCLGGNLLHSVRHGCLQGSKVVSLQNAIASYLHRLMGVMDKVDAIVCPSKFLAQKMIEGGFPAGKIHQIPTFVNLESINPSYSPGDYLLYFGRISTEKGIDVLLDAYRLAAMSQPGLKLKIVGKVNQAQYDGLHDTIRDLGPNVELCGEQNFDQLMDTVRRSRAVILPAICYDNMPNVILESYACGKPVIASNLGSFPEIVEDGTTGFLAPPGDAAQLAEKMLAVAADPALAEGLGRNARRKAEEFFSPQAHLARLTELFSAVAKR